MPLTPKLPDLPPHPRGPAGYGTMLKHFVVFAANEDDTIETITEIWARDLPAATKRAKQMFPDAADLYVTP